MEILITNWAISLHFSVRAFKVRNGLGTFETYPAMTDFVDLVDLANQSSTHLRVPKNRKISLTGYSAIIVLAEELNGRIMQEMKSFLLTCGSFALTASVVGNAFYQKQQFYPSVVYITKSNPSMAVSFTINVDIYSLTTTSGCQICIFFVFLVFICFDMTYRCCLFKFMIHFVAFWIFTMYGHTRPQIFSVPFDIYFIAS